MGEKAGWAVAPPPRLSGGRQVGTVGQAHEGLLHLGAEFFLPGLDAESLDLADR
jgi:hypothetical protein